MSERPSPSPRYEEFEAYRGIAALMIVIFHAYQFSRQASLSPTYVYEGRPAHHLFGNLDVGVAWFFALSGFLLFLPVARAAHGITPLQPVRAFLIRRAIRILPLYWVAILVVWTWRYSGQREEWVDLIQHLTFTHVFDEKRMFWTIGPAWSLAVEVHFYLALGLTAPLLVALCRSRKTAITRQAILLGSATALWLGGLALLGVNAFVRDIPESDAPAWFTLPAKLDNFAIGMMLAAIAASPVGSIRFGPRVALVVRLVGFATIGAVFSVRTVESVPSPLGVRDVYAQSASAVGFALVLASTVLGPRESRWRAWLSHRWLIWLGVISYSVYIWHEPIMIELGKREFLLRTDPEWFPVNAIVLVTLSIIAGFASYWIIERPTMELRHLFDKRGRLARRYEQLSWVRPESRSRNPQAGD